MLVMEFGWVPGIIKDVIKTFYQAWSRRPDVTCHARAVSTFDWYVDQWEDLDANPIDGITAELSVQVLLTNNGPVSTMIKNVYIELKEGKNYLGRLGYNRYRDRAFKIESIEIGPRKVWGPKWLAFRGSIANLMKIPRDLKAELIVEPVAQKPVSDEVPLLYE